MIDCFVNGEAYKYKQCNYNEVYMPNAFHDYICTRGEFCFTSSLTLASAEKQMI